MAWFTADFNRFFKELAAHNNKAWFDANRARYEAGVKEPFHTFVGAAITAIQRLDKSVDIEVKDAIFRIHRDVRFSRDKAPYKLEASAIISPAGRKDNTVPGIYFAFGPEAVRFYGGCYMPDRDQLYRIRTGILRDATGFHQACGGRAFTTLFPDGVQGERNKVLPAEFKGASAAQPLIANKQFYVGAELSPRLVTDPKLLDLLLDHFKAMRPLNTWLAAALRAD
jgi:uncharacterized protein (TIGR02453 family)